MTLTLLINFRKFCSSCAAFRRSPLLVHPWSVYWLISVLIKQYIRSISCFSFLLLVRLFSFFYEFVFEFFQTLSFFFFFFLYTFIPSSADKLTNKEKLHYKKRLANVTNSTLTHFHKHCCQFLLFGYILSTEVGMLLPYNHQQMLPLVMIIWYNLITLLSFL